VHPAAFASRPLVAPAILRTHSDRSNGVAPAEQVIAE
jgi:hypothetical protein